MKTGTRTSTAKITNGGRCYEVTNRVLGCGFEQELCDLLAEHGYWAHNLAQNQIGQPADVIAVKDNVAVLIDCKVCSDNRFPLSRIEGNQEGAMTLWEVRGNAYCYFAMKLTDGSIYMVHFDDLNLLENLGQRAITEAEFQKYPTFEQWLEYMEGSG